MYLAEAIKYVIEEDKNGPTSHFGDVVERLAGIVAHTSILVFKTGKNGLDEFGKMHAYRGLWKWRRGLSKNNVVAD